MSARVQVRGARVVITGAGSGIGAATAQRFSDAGALVVAVDIDAYSAAATALVPAPRRRATIFNPYRGRSVSVASGTTG